MAADVDNEGDCRPNTGNVGEVLTRTDSQISSAGGQSLFYGRDQMLVGSLVGNEVIGVEILFFFAQAE